MTASTFAGAGPAPEGYRASLALIRNARRYGHERADGSGVSEGVRAWTGTKSDGTRSAVTCENWGTQSFARQGTAGEPARKNAPSGAWTDSDTTYLCNNQAAIICFEL